MQECWTMSFFGIICLEFGPCIMSENSEMMNGRLHYYMPPLMTDQITLMAQTITIA